MSPQVDFEEKVGNGREGAALAGLVWPEDDMKLGVRPKKQRLPRKGAVALEE